MPRGRGRGRGAGDGARVVTNSQVQRAETRATQGALPSHDQAGKVHAGEDQDVSTCGMCERSVGDDAIGCDRCNAWFCPSEMCTGLPENAVALIVSLQDENSVLFVCTGCRVNPGSGAWTTKPATRSKQGKGDNDDLSLKQLYMVVKGLASEMAKLAAKLDEAIFHISLRSTTENDPSSQPSQPSTESRTRPPSGSPAANTNMALSDASYRAA